MCFNLDISFLLLQWSKTMTNIAIFWWSTLLMSVVVAVKATKAPSGFFSLRARPNFIVFLVHNSDFSNSSEVRRANRASLETNSNCNFGAEQIKLTWLCFRAVVNGFLTSNRCWYWSNSNYLHTFYCLHLLYAPHCAMLCACATETDLKLPNCTCKGSYAPNWQQRTSCSKDRLLRCALSTAVAPKSSNSWWPTGSYVLRPRQGRSLSTDIQTVAMIKLQYWNSSH